MEHLPALADRVIIMPGLHRVGAGAGEPFGSAAWSAAGIWPIGRVDRGGKGLRLRRSADRIGVRETGQQVGGGSARQEICLPAVRAPGLR